MRIDVALAVVELLHELGRRIPDDEGNGLGEHGEGVLFGGLIRHVEGVGLGGEREVDDGLREVDGALGHPDEAARFKGRDGEAQRLRVGKAHVLRGKARHAAGDVDGVLARFQHPCQPIDGGVGVGVAHGLVERRDEVVVLLARLVVEEGLLRGTLLDGLVCHGDGALVVDVAVEDGHLQRGEGASRVAVCEVGDEFERLVRDRDVLPAEAAFVRKGVFQKFYEILRL